MMKNDQAYLKILRCSHRKILEICLAIFQHYAWKSRVSNSSDYYLKLLLMFCGNFNFFDISLEVFVLGDFAGSTKPIS